jgi:argininosuccinate synthase
VENRLVGMKCRGVYETPGGTILYKAHEYAGDAVPGQDDRAQKAGALRLPSRSWCTTASGSRRCARRSAPSWTTQQTVTGKVKLKLYKGNIIKAGVWSPYSLYSEQIATFGESDYNQKDAEGFINLYGLPIGTVPKRDRRARKRLQFLHFLRQPAV